MTTKYDKAEVFEKKVRHVYRIALGAAVLHKATAWLGAGALTWATVVLMGGFASQLLISDFKWITLLVLLIAFLLTLSHFSINLISKKTLFIGSIHPVRFTYRDHHRLFVTLIELASLLFQLLLISVCLWQGFSNIHRCDFQSIHFYSFLINSAPPHPSSCPSTSNSTVLHPAAPLQHCLETCFSSASYNTSASSMAAICANLGLASSTSSNNLQICLYSFFLLLNSTSICAAVCLVYGWIVKPLVWRWLIGDGSLRRYHNEVLSRAMNLGLAEADNFDSRVFLLRALGEDLMMRNIGPLEVRRQNLEAIEHLYNHPQGPEMVYQGLASGDILLQQAAANIMGFWAKSNMRLDRQLELLCRMGDKLGLPGKAAEGAANSFSALAKQWVLKPIEPSPLLQVYVSRSRAAAGRRGGGAGAHVDGTAAGEGAAARADGAAAGLEGAAVRGAGGGAAAPADDSTAGEGGRVRADDSSVAGIDPTDDAAAGGGAAAPSQYGYTVVDKVIDAILQKLAPTLLIYVRVLDSFFMSDSVRRHVSESGYQNELEERLKEIINSRSDGMQPRTRLIAFSVLCRLKSSDGMKIHQHAKKSMEELLKSVDERFKEHLDKEAAGKKILWVEESERYKHICTQLLKPPGDWLRLVIINGKDMVAPGPDAVKELMSAVRKRTAQSGAVAQASIPGPL